MRLTRLTVAALLALCMAIVAIAPLSNLSAQANTVTLTLTIPSTYSDIYSAKFLSAFEDSHPGIKVQVKQAFASIAPPATGLDKHFEAVQNYVTTGDVVYVTTGNISAEDTVAGYFLDLAPFVNDDKNFNPDDFFPPIWQSYQWDKGIWALPVSADPFVLLYNPDAFDRAGLAYPSDKWTVDDLIDAARKLTTKDASGAIKPGIDMPFLQGYTFRAVTKNSMFDSSVIPNTPKFATPELADTMAKWLKLDNDGAIGTEIAKAPMSVAPAIWLALKESLFPGEKRSAALLPGGKAAISVNGFAVSAGTQHPEQAYALAEWLTTRVEPAGNGQSATVPARISLKGASGTDQPAFKLDVTPEVQAVIDQSLANAIPLSEMRFVDYLTTAYNKMKSDKADALAALQDAENSAIKAFQQATLQRDKVKGLFTVATPIPVAAVPGGKVELKFGIGAAAPLIPNTDAWNKLVADFTASDPNVAKVTFAASTSTLEKLATEYDCFYLPYNGLAPEKLNKILALDPLLAADSNFDKADIVNGALAQVTRDNKIYALPADISPGVLKYDTAAFSKAGVPAPALQWTTSDFIDALKQLKTYNGDKPAFVPVNTFGDYITNLIVAFGGMPIDYRTTPTTVSFTDPATVDAIRQVTDLAKQGYFKYHVLFGGQLDLVVSPEPSLIKPASLSLYSLSSLLGGQQSGDFKMTMYPRGSKYTAINYNLGTLYISATTPNPEACYRWISAVAKAPNLFGSMPARLSVINDPALVTAQGAEAVAVYKQIADILQDPNTISLPSYSAGTSTTDLIIQLELYKALDKYMAEGSSVSLESVLSDSEAGAVAFVGCADTIPPLDMTSTDSQKAYFNAAKQCALKSDPDLAQFFAGVTTN